MRYLLIIILVSFFEQPALSQDKLFTDSVFVNPLIDSLLIDRNKSNWSLRVFTNLKEQRFRISDKGDFTSYVPNNPLGVGVGFATRKLIIDIAFNIKPQNATPTERFDLKGSYNNNGHFIDFFFQRYKGFNVDEAIFENSYFNDELVSLSTGLNYLYIINKKDYSVGALRSLISEHSVSSLTFGVGAYTLYLNQKNIGYINIDNGTIPTDADIQMFKGFGLGPLIGGSGLLSLGSNLYTSLDLKAGIGIMSKTITTSGQELPNSDKLNALYQLRANFTFAYVRDKFYLNLACGTGLYQTELLPDIKHIINMTNAKLVLGYKLFKN